MPASSVWRWPTCRSIVNSSCLLEIECRWPEYSYWWFHWRSGVPSKSTMGQSLIGCVDSDFGGSDRSHPQCGGSRRSADTAPYFFYCRCAQPSTGCSGVWDNGGRRFQRLSVSRSLRAIESYQIRVVFRHRCHFELEQPGTLLVRRHASDRTRTDARAVGSLVREHGQSG